MSEDRSEEIAALLQEGLDAYGEDDVGDYRIETRLQQANCVGMPKDVGRDALA